MVSLFLYKLCLNIYTADKPHDGITLLCTVISKHEAMGSSKAINLF